MSEPVLFEDVFAVSDVNSAKYDRVSRVVAESLDHSCNITLDVNTELYPIVVGDKLTLDLASTLNLDGSKDDSKGWREVGMGELTLANEFDYVCHGKIYKFEEAENDFIKVYVSFGGLLMYIKGPYKKLNPLRLDYVYLLLKR